MLPDGYWFRSSLAWGKGMVSVVFSVEGWQLILLVFGLFALGYLVRDLEYYWWDRWP